MAARDVGRAGVPVTRPWLLLVSWSRWGAADATGQPTTPVTVASTRSGRRKSRSRSSAMASPDRECRRRLRRRSLHRHARHRRDDGRSARVGRRRRDSRLALARVRVEQHASRLDDAPARARALDQFRSHQRVDAALPEERSRVSVPVDARGEALHLAALRTKVARQGRSKTGHVEERDGDPASGPMRRGRSARRTFRCPLRWARRRTRGCASRSHSRRSIAAARGCWAARRARP